MGQVPKEMDSVLQEPGISEELRLRQEWEVDLPLLKSQTVMKAQSPAPTLLLRKEQCTMGF